MIFAIDKQIVQQQATSFILVDNSLWGLSGNPARNARALVLFVTRTDKDGVRTLLGNTPDVGNPLTVAQWTLNSLTDPLLSDGWIEKILFSIDLWDSVTAYVTNDIIFNSANSTFYKCILGHTNHQPPNGTYWTSIAAAALYTNELANTSAQMEIVVMNDLVTPIIEDRKNAEFQRVADEFLYDLDKAKDFNEADFLDSILEAAYAALNNDRPSEAEVIVRAITSYVLRYGAVI